MSDYDICIACGQSLRGGDYVLPWEEGDNPSAFIRCPHCGYENERDGFGEDDD